MAHTVNNKPRMTQSFDSTHSKCKIDSQKAFRFLVPSRAPRPEHRETLRIWDPKTHAAIESAESVRRMSKSTDSVSPNNDNSTQLIAIDIVIQPDARPTTLSQIVAIRCKTLQLSGNCPETVRELSAANEGYGEEAKQPWRVQRASEL